MNFALGFRPPSSGSSDSGAGGRVPMENLEKQLICPVCLEMFSKPVVILPCQHNLCRKCASDVFQSANPPLSRGSSAFSGSRFRCPSCRHEVVLDRHGVYGLQRNLLVENIIDLYRQQEASRLVELKPEQQQQQQQRQQQQHLVCEDHGEEKLNIYCLSCQTPTCSMCKVFGKHKECDVAPLGSVYVRKKTELSNGIAALVASNDHIQEVISGMEEICHATEENGRRRRELVAGRFAALGSVLEEKKQELVGLISREQDDKLRLVRRLVRRHGDELEAAVTLVESAIHVMEETHMALFVENADLLLEKMAATARASTLERPELGFETMDHFTVDTDAVAVMLMNIDFCSADAEEAAEDEGDESELEVYSWS